MKKITINTIKKKKGKIPITCLTAYSKDTATILDKYCDIILVGDSIGMVLYGMKSTRDISIETMILHAATVKKFSKKSLVVFDMPYKTYSNKFDAYKNAKKIIKLTKCDAVKLEGGKKISDIVKYLTKNKIPVMGHIGLLPQSSNKFKLKGKNQIDKEKILGDAISLSNSGVFAVVIECVVESLARRITSIVPVPTIGIGASKYCDGQILVVDDMIGLSGFRPKFVKQYSNMRKIIEKSVKRYCNDVKKRRFPYYQNIYRS
jgi:3-methyl-2-oxobutanoate hydroxymethyltransferase